MSDECNKQFCPRGSEITTYHHPVMDTSIAMDLKKMPQRKINPRRQQPEQVATESKSKQIMFQSKNRHNRNNSTVSSTKRVPYQAKHTKPIYRRDGNDIQYVPEKHRPNNRNPQRTNSSDAELGEGLWAINHESDTSDGLELSPTKETTKIKLILTLEKLRKEKLDYTLVSSYFSSMFKQIERKYPSHRTLAYTLEEMLVFERDELKDSEECYRNAIARVRKASYIDFSAIHQVVTGLASILKGL